MIVGIFLLALASAFIAGTCESFSFNTNILNYTVSGNSSDTNGMNVSLSNKIIEICFVPNYKIDSFTLTFYSDIPEELPVTYYGFGTGGTKINYSSNKTNLLSQSGNGGSVKIESNQTINYEITKESKPNYILSIFFGLLLIILFIIIVYLLTNKTKKKIEIEIK